MKGGRKTDQSLSGDAKPITLAQREGKGGNPYVYRTDPKGTLRMVGVGSAAGPKKGVITIWYRRLEKKKNGATRNKVTIMALQQIARGREEAVRHQRDSWRPSSSTWEN